MSNQVDENKSSIDGVQNLETIPPDTGEFKIEEVKVSVENNTEINPPTEVKQSNETNETNDTNETVDTDEANQTYTDIQHGVDVDDVDNVDDDRDSEMSDNEWLPPDHVCQTNTVIICTN